MFRQLKIHQVGIAGLLLVGTSLTALAQQATPAPAAPATDMMVAAETATHTAMLAGEGEATGTAWFIADEQNHSLKWTIDFAGATPTGAGIFCATDTDPAATPAAGAPAAGAPAATPAPATPAAGAPAGDAMATMTPAMTGQIMTVDMGAGAGAPAVGAETTMTPDFATLTEVVDLGAQGGDLMSPLQGETADLGEAVFAQLVAGACFVAFDTMTDAAGGAATPAPAAMDPVTPAPAMPAPVAPAP